MTFYTKLITGLKLFAVCLLVLINYGCSSSKIHFAAIGDTPYYESDSELKKLSDSLLDIYKNGLPFVIHVGDIMRGSTNCSAELFHFREKIFSQSPVPFMITPGDNEFNDCKYPVKARQHFRNIILKNPPINQVVTGSYPDSISLNITRQSEMIENASWRYKNVDFIMLVLPDMPGIYRLKPGFVKEIIELNIRYLVENTRDAIKNNSDALVIVMHSNPVTCRLKFCEIFHERLKNEIKLFAKPVLFLNGSIHEAEFEGPGYFGLSNLWHIRPGSEPGETWPEIIFSNEKKSFSVKWH